MENLENNCEGLKPTNWQSSEKSDKYSLAKAYRDAVLGHLPKYFQTIIAHKYGVENFNPRCASYFSGACEIVEGLALTASTMMGHMGDNPDLKKWLTTIGILSVLNGISRT